MLTTTALLFLHAALPAADFGPDSPRTALSIPRVDRDRVDFDVREDGTIWVRGRTYKASFGRDGATYVPFLGSDAPRNYPVELDVTRVTIGGTDLAFDADAPARREGMSVAFDRGSFTERFLVTPDGVEQTFEFANLPCRGEIVVAVGVDSMLASRSDADGFRFENELGHVRYGNAFALDARGRRDALDARLAGNGIEIRVPATRVDAALLPLTIDPVITTYAVRDTPIDEFAADTAYDATEGAYLTVVEEVFSALDHDVRAVLHTPGGTAFLQQFIDSSNANWTAPAVANNNAADQFLVVAAVGASPGREIQGRTVESDSTLALSPVIQISTLTAAGDQYAPDVGGDSSTTGPSYYCVVYEVTPGAGERDVRGRLVDTAGALVGPLPILISNDPVDLDGNPAVSNSNGHTSDVNQFWNIAFEREVSPANHNIYARRIAFDGTLSSGPTLLAGTSADERNPSCTAGLDLVDGARPWMLAYQIATGADGWDVRTRVIDGLSILTTFELSAQFASNSFQQIEPVCDTDGESFVVAYLEQATLGFGSTDIKLSALYWSSGALGVTEGNVSVSPGLETDLRPKVCAKRSGGATSRDVVVVFDRDDSGPNDVLATYYQIPEGGPVTAYCFGDGSGQACPCGNVGLPGRGCPNSFSPLGGRLFTGGAASIEANSITLLADSLPPNASVLFFQGTAQTASANGIVFGDGLRCASGTVTRLGTKTAAAGLAIYPGPGDQSVAVRGNVSPGQTRTYQAHYRNSASFCTVATYNLTNGIRVLWIP